VNKFKVDNIANNKKIGIITGCEVLGRIDEIIGSPKNVCKYGVADENLAIAHDLCINYNNLSEPALLSQLESVLTKDPNVVYEKDNDGFTLLHIAAALRSPEFCKMIAEVDSELVRSTSNEGFLPIYNSCSFNNVQTAKYLYHLYPESISTPNNDGYFALHSVLAARKTSFSLDLVGFLLKHDKGAVSSPIGEFGHLPLHMALMRHDLAVTKLVFDSYPEAIFINIGNSRLSPLDIARQKQNEGCITFIENQIEFVRQAREEQVTDDNGQLPIHRALQNNDTSAGTIKLMAQANIESVVAANNLGLIPLHIACQVGNVDVVRHLVEANESSLQIKDAMGELPLHHACNMGNCEVVIFILQQSTHGSSITNAAKKLPIESVLYDSDCDRNSLEYVEAVKCLLCANPEALVHLIARKPARPSVAGKKRKHSG